MREVPPGTNGGVSLVGTIAGFGGAGVIAVTAAVLTPFCNGWGMWERGAFVVGVTVWGGMGSLVDSALGGWFQESVVDTRTGKVVEGVGGGRVLVREARVVGVQQGQGKKRDDDEKAGRRVESGLGVLDNNAVNALMAAGMSVGGMVVVAWWWGVPLMSVLNGY